MKRRPLSVAAAFAATAVLFLTACGGGDGGDGGGGGGSKGSGETSAPPPASASPATDSDRPDIELPADLSYTFDWPRTGDTEKDAVLADSEQSIKAVDLAITHQNPLDKAYLYYYEGAAAAGTETFVQAYVDAKARVTGSYRYYEAVANVNGSDRASLVYCEDQSKAYDMYFSPKRVDRTAVTKNSYVLYSTQLHRNDKGVWVVEKIVSQRGSTECQP
ncbi:hypothetical protein ACH4TV_10630 [Streptomyces sp. NPDC020898]|uniref:hypothetical protein n=1 Tax=Streptomyces sp. NPDC020898 TaxID=3365101 RepID=UPI0037A59797